MKEQDAAHSFEKTLKDVELKGNFYGMEYAPFMMKVFEKFSLYKHHETTASGSTELTRLRSELQQEREQLIECLEAIHRWYITDDGYWGTETHKFAESLIKKAKLNN